MEKGLPTGTLLQGKPQGGRNLSECLMRAWRLFCTATVILLPDVSLRSTRTNQRKARGTAPHPPRAHPRFAETRKSWLDP
ncbi:hypothetical protein CCUS01_12740 [Colletotrichum cuscutae]|uniref:Uncharacterized protein n=2 Tax=Colletotrichum acutatum species complex TaxID=2707335 RepID=A0AAJ0E788_9PEZI|nr:uncharacterized protein CCOS01_00535 [Colletotrichum costaricense]KAK1445246.1 hypothetical protein CCUS01_12740 [Colletotrichum cuscutae]KAK1539221.1 hypothetical protein CCOS01_00535 [Colletotrichum costaricense]